MSDPSESTANAPRPGSRIDLEIVLSVLVVFVLYGGVALAWGDSGRFLKYPLAASQWAQGMLAAERIVDFSPLYLAVHRLLLDLGGNGVAVGWLQIVVVALTTAGLLRLLDRLGVERRWRVVVATCWILNPSLLVYTHILEPEALLIGLEVALLLLVARGLAGDDVPGWGMCVLVAAVACGALLTRPTLLPAGLAALIALWLRFRGRRQLGSRLAVMLALLLLAAVGLTIRNGLVAGSWSPSVMNPGTVLYEGNNPTSWGNSAAYPPAIYELGASGESDVAHQSYRVLARLSEGDPDLSVGGVNSYWIAKALAFTTDHLGRAARLLGVKLDSVARSEREHDLGPAEALDRWLGARWIRGVPVSLVVFVAMYGLGLAIKRWREHLVLLVILGAQVTSMLVLYASARQRLTLLPCLLVLAAMALQHLGRQGRRGALVGALLVALGLAWMPATERQNDRRHHRAGLAQGRTLLLQAQAARDAGRLGRAMELSTRAYVAAPDLLERARLADLPLDERALGASALRLSGSSDSDRFDAARLFALLGDTPRALQLLESIREARFLRSAVRSSLPEVHAAHLSSRAGETATARSLLDAALAKAPGEPFALAFRSVVLRLQADSRGDDDEAVLRRYVDDVSADLLLADAEIGLAQHRAAAGRLEPWIAQLAEAGEAARRLRLMHIAAVAGFDSPRAASLYVDLMRSGSEPVLYEHEVVGLFAKSALADLRDPEAQWLYVRILRQYGRFGDAADHLGRLEEDVLSEPRLQQERRFLEAASRL